jgi:hypothetical protein
LAGNLAIDSVLASATLLFTAVLWIMEVRSSLYWAAHRQNLQGVWPRPSNARLGWVTATNAVALLYAIVYLFWWWCAYQWHLACLLLLLGGGVGIFLAVFTILNYRALWSHREHEEKK